MIRGPATLNALGALLTDTHGVVLDITRSLQMRDRITRFQEAMTRELDAEDRHALAAVLVQSLHAHVT